MPLFILKNLGNFMHTIGNIEDVSENVLEHARSLSDKLLGRELMIFINSGACTIEAGQAVSVRSYGKVSLREGDEPYIGLAITTAQPDTEIIVLHAPYQIPISDEDGKEEILSEKDVIDDVYMTMAEMDFLEWLLNTLQSGKSICKASMTADEKKILEKMVEGFC